MIRTAVLARAASVSASASVPHALAVSASRRTSDLAPSSLSLLPYRRPQRCKASSRKQNILSLTVPYSTTSRKNSTPTPSKSKQNKGKEKLNDTEPPQDTEPTSKVRVTDKRTDAPLRQADLAAREAQKVEKAKEDEAAQSQDQQRDSPTASPAQPSQAEPLSSTATPPQTTPASATQSSPASSPQSQSAQPQPPSSSSNPSSSTSASAASTTFSSSELLKQRLQQAQDRFEKPVPSTGNKAQSDAQAVHQQQEQPQGQQSQQQQQQQQQQSHPQPQTNPQPQQSHPQQVFPASSSAPHSQPSTSNNPADSSSSRNDGMLPSPSIPTMENLEIPPRFPSLENLFDTRTFVKRLEDGGFLNQQRLEEQARQQLQRGDIPKDSLARQQSVLDWINAAKRGDAADADAEETHDTTASPDQPMELQTQAKHLPHDPAQAIMQLIISTVRMRAGETIGPLLNRTEAENHRYLFDVALSDLRTELKTKARNDAATLQSITTLLQRQVDSLSNRMRDDVEQMKHDIRVSIDNRKAENKQQQRALEQEIQNLYNRFTISVSDRKTETEMTIKGDLTRRSLLLVFGCAAIALVSLYVWEQGQKFRRETKRAEEEEEAADAAATADELLRQRFVNSSDGRDHGASNHPHASMQGYGPAGSTAIPHPGAGTAPGSGVHLRPAEDLGLVERYEPDAEGRYV